MPEFTYEALAHDGQSLRGQLSSDSVTDAIVELESRGLTIVSIQLESAPASASSSRSDETPNGVDRRPAISRSRGTPIDRHFDAAIEGRDVLVPALSALTDEMPRGPGRSELRRLIKTLNTAETVNDLRSSNVAVRWLPLLATGIRNQTSSHRLGELIAQTSRETVNRSQRRQLMLYPLIVLVLSVVVFTVLCLLVTPTYAPAFKSFGLRLPPATRAVIFIAEQVQFHPFRLFLAAVAATASIYGLMRLWAHLGLSTRLFGRLTAGNSANVSAMASFTDQLAELLDIDVSLPDALWLAGQGCGHPYFRRVAEQLARDAHRASGPLKDSSVAHAVPGNVLYALNAGADGTANTKLLHELSELYSDRVRSRIDWTSGAQAQLAIVLIGLAVGFVVLALFAPMTTLISGLS